MTGKAQDTKQADQSVKPPYISQNIWKPFFEKMRNRSVPSTKALSYDELALYSLPSPPALQSAIKFLGLIDAKAYPTEKFKLIQATGDQWKKNLEVLIRAAYKDLLDMHPLEHAKYDDILNYFGQKYSAASKQKMAKSFGVLCKMAGLSSPAFDKMRSSDVREATSQPSGAERQKKITPKGTPASRASSTTREAGGEETDLVKEFIKTNPMPSSAQWDAASLNAFFEQYRKTIRMLKGQKADEEDTS
ncbi:MAG: DUF5343 domain-containing protein [Candidatus Omnitrophica bacterium]|nr:DUF5343 domain-containing protein [Candidatus Omnitrophota bacterium]